MSLRLPVVLVFAVFAGCSNVTEPDAAPRLLTGLPRTLSANEARVTRAANQFAFTMFRRLTAAEPAASNVFVSPLSITLALGMTMNGANGTTLDEMRTTLGFGAADLAEINDGYKSLMALEHGLDKGTTFTIANSVWYRSTLPVEQSFVETVRSVFDAEVNASPFDASTVTAINNWVSDNTNAKITKIIDTIEPDLVMCLVNAIYFKGAWRAQFDPARTSDATFHAADGDQTVKMMQRDPADSVLRLGGDGDLSVGELLYGNGAFVMTIVMPTSPAADINTVAASLDTARWNALMATLRVAHLGVHLPKLKLEYGRELTEDLQALGMHVPFVAGGADFTRMSSRGRDMYISFVKHKSYVDIDEEGTEAAAVTAVGIELTSAGPDAFSVDRPFIFAIRERFSGTILFIGKIARIPG